MATRGSRKNYSHATGRQRVVSLRCASLALLMGIACMSAASAESTRAAIERGIAGLNWGASEQQILASYPNSKKVDVPFPTVMVRQPEGVFGIRTFKDGVSLNVVDGKLRRATLLLDGTNTALFVRTMNAALGKPRAFVEKSAFGTYTHIYEWSQPRAGASVMYTTRDGKSETVPEGLNSARIQGGPITESLIDATRELNEQISRPKQ